MGRLQVFRLQDEFGILWWFIRQNDTVWREQVYWSLHYHIIGLYHDFEESNPNGEEGRVAKNVEHNGSHSLAPFTT